MGKYMEQEHPHNDYDVRRFHERKKLHRKAN